MLTSRAMPAIITCAFWPSIETSRTRPRTPMHISVLVLRNPDHCRVATYVAAFQLDLDDDNLITWDITGLHDRAGGDGASRQHLPVEVEAVARNPLGFAEA